MKRTITTFVITTLCVMMFAQSENGYPIGQVPFTSVRVTDGFWGQRLKASRDVTIPLAFSKCEETGRYENFIKAANPSEDYIVGGFSFDDTDPYKTIEGASYSLQTYPDPKMVAYIDSVLDIIAIAQEPDGYLYTPRTMNPKHPHDWSGDSRWVKEEVLSHELYNLGHMLEGAIAHYQATGSRKFLDIAIRYADCVCREVGPDEGQFCVVPGHQIAEMGLCKLYLLTGDKKYLDEAKFMLDYRGKTEIHDIYTQSHLPIVDQKEAVGHAVRAAYMYAGIADVAALTGQSEYIAAIDTIWENMVSKKLYITGGIGSTANGEAFGPNYDLPNMSAYCETCAAIGNVYVNYRLFLLHGESKYYDVLERSLYNGLISGISLDGGAFFYPNPLESMGQHKRQPWFGCACCPSNVSRFIPSLPGYIYAVDKRNVYVNLFMPNTADLKVGGKKVAIEQQTEYPWDGDIAISISDNKAGQWAMKIRIPGWVKNQVVPSDLYFYTDGLRPQYSITINGEDSNGELTSDGYFTIERKWKKGDVVSVHFDMEPRTVRANDNVVADRGFMAVERGPLVYCAEWSDNDFDIMGTLVNQNPVLTVADGTIDATEYVEASYPVKTISTNAQVLDFDDEGRLTVKDVNLTLIPYYAWCHRGCGKMRVWLSQDLKATTPTQPETLASRSVISASKDIPAKTALNDRVVPMNADDQAVTYTRWWPNNGQKEWVAYEFPESTMVRSATVYWFDDAPWGGLRIPKSWSIYYKDSEGKWQAVDGADKYTTNKGIANTVNFNPVKTTALKLELEMPDNNSVGISEWSVK